MKVFANQWELLWSRATRKMVSFTGGWSRGGRKGTDYTTLGFKIWLKTKWKRLILKNILQLDKTLLNSRNMSERTYMESCKIERLEQSNFYSNMEKKVANKFLISEVIKNFKHLETDKQMNKPTRLERLPRKFRVSPISMS